MALLRRYHGATDMCTGLQCEFYDRRDGNYDDGKVVAADS